MGGCLVIKALAVRNKVNKGHPARDVVANQQCCVSVMFQRLVCVLWVVIEKQTENFEFSNIHFYLCVY